MAPRRPGGFTRHRPRPTAYRTAAPYPAGCGHAGADRTIVLATGRGCVRISPAEAEALAAELLAAAGGDAADQPGGR